MAVTIGALASGEQSAHAADKFLALADNALDRRNVTSPKWVIATDHTDPAASFLGNWSSTSKNLSTHPIARLYDRDFGNQSKPDVTTPAAIWSALFDLDDTAGSVIDSIIIGGHNFNDLAGTLTVQFWVHDNADEPTGSGGGTSRWLLAQWTGALAKTKKRLVSYNLGAYSGLSTYRSVSTVRYAQVSVRSTSNIQPAIGEIVIGRRRQFSRNPRVGWAKDSWFSGLSRYRSESNRRGTVEHFSGARRISGEFRPTGSDSFGLDELTTIKSMLTDCRYGAKPLAFCMEPNTAPEKSYWCEYNGDPEITADDYALRGFELAAEEISPHVEDEWR